MRKRAAGARSIIDSVQPERLHRVPQAMAACATNRDMGAVT